MNQTRDAWHRIANDGFSDRYSGGHLVFDYQKLKETIGRGVFNFPNLARAMNVPRFKNRDFSRFLSNLVNQNLLGITKNKDYFIPQIKGETTGIIRINAKGFGFVDNNEGSIFVAARNTANAFDGDEVRATIFQDPLYPSELQGLVTSVLKRNTTELVGTIKSFAGVLGLVPFGSQVRGSFRFQNPHGLRVNENVKVKIIKYGRPAIIDVIKKIGLTTDPFIDFKLAIEEANVVANFSHQAQAEASQIEQVVNPRDFLNRSDIRDQLVVTIDGDDTKDFDDAIEVATLANNNYKLRVHIADVSHYVKKGTALDEESKQRGTSIYLPGQVIPMLPEALSNGICSLNPGVDRLTITTEMEINQSGETVKYQVYPSVINSKFRLTYKQVNNYYHNKHLFPNQALREMLDHARALSLIIRNQKTQAGYIDFEIAESKISVDSSGKVKEITARERFESEILIEDFMVRANETVAMFVEKNKLPFIYRVHSKPELEKIQMMQGTIATLGIPVKIPANPHPKDFAKVVNQIKTTRFDDFMKILLLRTMAKAVYSPNNAGHFGLASKAYTHFTSPIRRYPDLMVHRMLREYFFNNNKNAAGYFQNELPSTALHSSEMEQKALELERRVSDIKKAEFYENYIGHSLEGTIVSMMKFGFFVEFPNKAGGLVHSETFRGTKYKLSASGHTYGSHEREFKIGDKVKVVVVSVSKWEGKINLAVAS